MQLDLYESVIMETTFTVLLVLPSYHLLKQETDMTFFLRLQQQP